MTCIGQVNKFFFSTEPPLLEVISLIFKVMPSFIASEQINCLCRYFQLPIYLPIDMMNCNSGRVQCQALVSPLSTLVHLSINRLNFMDTLCTEKISGAKVALVKVALF